jgi:hypothetical protein
MSAESSIEQFEQYDSGPTSNDLLESLIAGNAQAAMSDPIDAQGPDRFELEPLRAAAEPAG